MAAVAGQEDHLHSAQATQPQLIRRGAEGRVNRQFLDVLQTLHRVEPAAAEHPKAGLAEVNGMGDGHHH